MVDTQRFLVRFWGVRGSYPVPGSRTLRYGGNTSCIEIEAGPWTLIFDAGSGIIRLGERLVQRAKKRPFALSLFITHGHGDHLLGLPFFAPLYDPDATIDFFGPKLAERSLEELVTPLMSPPYFPVDIQQLPSHRTFSTLVKDQSIIWKAGTERPELLGDASLASATVTEVCVDAKYSTHHPADGALLYRIKCAGRCVIYATDIEWDAGFDEEVIAFMEGADLLIHDAQYTPDDYQQTKHGFGHSTYEMAAKAAKLAHIHELVLFHHEPTYDDAQLDWIEAETIKSFASSRLAYEGLEIDLLGPRATHSRTL